MSKLFLDVDGILADFVGGFVKHYQVEHPYPKYRGEWSFLKYYPNIDYNTLPMEWWANLEPTIECQQIVNLAKKYTDNVWLLTTPSKHPDCWKGKLSWVEKYLPQFAIRLIVDQDKASYAKGNILIDDADHNIEAFNAAGGRGILLPRIWNSLHPICDTDIISRLASQLFGVG